MNFFDRENSKRGDTTKIPPLQPKGTLQASKESLNESSREVEEPENSPEPILARGEEQELHQK